MTRCFQNEARKNAPPWKHLKPGDDEGDIAIDAEEADENQEESPKLTMEKRNVPYANMADEDKNTEPEETPDAVPTNENMERYAITDTNPPGVDLEENNTVEEETPKEAELNQKDNLL